MIRVHKDNRTLGYFDSDNEIVSVMPEYDTVLSVKFLSNGRKILYQENGWYYIEKTNKEKGIYSGDICPVCSRGEMVDMNGCAVCNSCAMSLKCGL